MMRTDRIVSISAILISLMTLVVLILQTRMIREQQQNAVYPHLMISNEGFGGPNYKMRLSNEGIGPAFIEELKISYQDSIIYDDLVNFLFNNIEGMDTVKNLFHSNLWVGRLIPANDIIYLLEMRNSEEDAIALLTILQELFDEHFAFEITYRSIYGEKWRLSIDEGQPVKIDD